MKKSVHLRVSTWEFLHRELTKMTEEELKIISKKMKLRYKNRRQIEEHIMQDPAAFLFHLGIFEHPELLKDTVIELEDEVDYLIKKRAARSIARGEPYITLERLHDQEDLTVKRDALIKAFLENHCFDQISHEQIRVSDVVNGRF